MCFIINLFPLFFYKEQNWIGIWKSFKKSSLQMDRLFTTIAKPKILSICSKENGDSEKMWRN